MKNTDVCYDGAQDIILHRFSQENFLMAFYSPSLSLGSNLSRLVFESRYVILEGFSMLDSKNIELEMLRNLPFLITKREQNAREL